MAHFAQLDENNVVTQVIVVNNDAIDNLPFSESEPVGIAFCQSLYGVETRWAQTSYNANFRKRYASVGDTFNAERNVFITPKPIEFPSWVLDTETQNCDSWVPPVPQPTNIVCKWDEPSVSWVEVPKPQPSWVASGNPLRWVPPVPYPTDGKRYRWDEPTLSWIEIVV